MTVIERSGRGTPPSATLRVKSPQRQQDDAKESRPETISQALHWDAVKNQVVRAGLCERCAAQYAWGIQIGFADSKPPCDDCAVLVAQSNGRQRPNSWRTMHRIRGGGWKGR